MGGGGGISLTVYSGRLSTLPLKTRPYINNGTFPRFLIVFHQMYPTGRQAVEVSQIHLPTELRANNGGGGGGDPFLFNGDDAQIASNTYATRVRTYLEKWICASLYEQSTREGN